MTTQGKTLYWVDPPDDERDTEQVARELISLYRSEFFLTTSSLCKLFRCDRQWVQSFIRPQVKHISISYFFRKYIVEHFSSQFPEKKIEEFMHSSYFYSAKELEQFWKKTAIATQKNVVIDLADYMDLGTAYSVLLNEQQRHLTAKKGRDETTKHMAKMEQLLTKEGFMLYSLSKKYKQSWMPVKLPRLPLTETSEPLQSVASIMKTQHIQTDTSAYRYLQSQGAVHIQFGGKVLWAVYKHGGRMPFSVPINLLEISKKSSFS